MRARQPVNCECQAAGWCPSRQMAVTSGTLAKCQRGELPRSKDARRLQSSTELPCVHRGSVLRQDTCKLERCVGGPVVDVFACAIAGECTINQHAIKGVKVCRKCDDRGEQKPVAPVAVIIPCHNYGRFLPEALDSLNAQIMAPAEIVVVDDASTDDTAEVCERYGVRRIAVDVRNIHKARAAGFAATTAPWVTFFDADDLLRPDYLSEGVKRFDTGVGIVFTDCQNFGLRNERLNFQPGDISQRNYIHAASLARRIALESARVFERDIPACTLEDWYIWRQLLADGWKAVKSPAVHQYRRHGEGHTVYLTTRPHFEVAGLAMEHVTIAIPLSGRRQWWPRIADWLERQAWPTDQTRILIVDTSDDEAFGRDVRHWLAGCRYGATQYVAMRVGDAGLADANRHREEVYRGVQRAMPRIYNRVRQEIATPYTLIVEDDVLPPVDAVERLMRGMEQDTVSVSGAYRSRYQAGYFAWDRSCRVLTEPGEGLQVVGGTGFGCLLLRSSVFTATVLHHGGKSGDFDPNFFEDISSAGWVAKIDWSVRCRHADLE